jgi:hypothetical protein
VACNEAQKQAWGREQTPGNVVEDWIETLRADMGNPNVEWVLISGRGRRVNRCTPAGWCSITGASLNHLAWPDGIFDKSGRDYEPVMLDFLREHAR